MIAGLVLLSLPLLAQTPDAGPAPDGGTPFQESVTRTKLLGGVHWRIETAQGPAHVWKPPGYRRATAGVVLYVHGYYTHVDQAWQEQHLAQQFKDSGRNALFIATEAPNGGSEDVWVKDPAALLDAASRLIKEPIPSGPVVAVGHSGAYRTLASWLSFDRIKEIVLLDALYDREDDFESWSAADPGGGRKLINVTYETVVRSEVFYGRIKTPVRRNDIPLRFSDFSKRERNASFLYLQSQYDHMALVNDGKVIPLLLRLSPLPAR